MKTYNSFKEIDSDLKKLDLERQIYWEELKHIKAEVKEDLQPLNWVSTALKIASKFGGALLIKKIIK